MRKIILPDAVYGVVFAVCVTAEAFPGHVSHRRSEGQSIVEGLSLVGEERKENRGEEDGKKLFQHFAEEVRTIDRLKRH